jgi:hypothetical protein
VSQIAGTNGSSDPVELDEPSEADGDATAKSSGDPSPQPTSKESIDVQAAISEIRLRSWRALATLSPRLRDVREVVEEAVRQRGGALRWASRELRRDPRLVRTAVENQGLALRFADEELTRDVDIVSAAIMSQPQALQFAHPVLRGNFDVVKLAVSGDRSSRLTAEETEPCVTPLQVCHPVLRYALRCSTSDVAFNADFDLVMSAVCARGDALLFAAPKLRSNIDIARAACISDGTALQFVEGQARCDAELVALAAMNGAHMCHVPPQFRTLPSDPLSRARNLAIITAMLRHSRSGRSFLRYVPVFDLDRELIETSLQRHPWELQHLPHSLKCIPDLVLAAVRADGGVLEYAPPHLRSRRDVLDAALHATKNGGTHALTAADPRFLRDRDLVKLALELTAADQLRETDSPAARCGPSLLWLLSESLRGDDEIVQLAVRCCPDDLQSVPSHLRTRQLVLEALRRHGAEVLPFVEAESDPSVIEEAALRACVEDPFAWNGEVTTRLLRSFILRGCELLPRESLAELLRRLPLWLRHDRKIWMMSLAKFPEVWEMMPSGFRGDRELRLLHLNHQSPDLHLLDEDELDTETVLELVSQDRLWDSQESVLARLLRRVLTTGREAVACSLLRGAKQLQCGICLESLLDKHEGSAQCGLGHTFCGTCLDGMEQADNLNCPICRTPHISREEFVRNRVVDELHDLHWSTDVRCRWGCGFAGRRRAVQLHEEELPEGCGRCPHSCRSCGAEITRYAFVQHARIAHRVLMRGSTLRVDRNLDAVSLLGTDAQNRLSLEIGEEILELGEQGFVALDKMTVSSLYVDISGEVWSPEPVKVELQVKIAPDGENPSEGNSSPTLTCSWEVSAGPLLVVLPLSAPLVIGDAAVTISVRQIELGLC